jgi:hypothetical protein
VGIKPRLPVGGGNGAANVRVANVGNVPLAGGTTVTLVYSTDQTFDAGDRTAATLPLGTVLNPRRRRALKFRFLYPEDLPAGSYYLVAVGDPGTTDVEVDNNAAGSATPVTFGV